MYHIAVSSKARLLQTQEAEQLTTFGSHWLRVADGWGCHC